ncbi:hypothetical protein SAMN05443248_1877 [Bradyrhizobium erythrophlei]|jgi:hypothetical protein|uniref:Uncharacterized protein n=1 Tax=Bradyrhizobium erythrophlei TaxID=1437360 RepID=A0A1M5KM38_9BRAD|nr:hypothetical protein SAMN05443248_1877 [Bradyrhizobium erythrophlei]
MMRDEVPRRPVRLPVGALGFARQAGVGHDVDQPDRLGTPRVRVPKAFQSRMLPNGGSTTECTPRYNRPNPFVIRSPLKVSIENTQVQWPRSAEETYFDLRFDNPVVDLKIRECADPLDSPVLLNFPATAAEGIMRVPISYFADMRFAAVQRSSAATDARLSVRDVDDGCKASLSQKSDPRS